jgi:hypothetical protein
MIRDSRAVRVALLMLFALSAAAEQQVKTLNDFDSDADLRAWEFKHKSATLSDQHVTHGSRSVKIAPNEYVNSFRLPRDWSGYDALEFDAFVEGDGPVGGTLLIGDEPWQKSGGSYWNRHNGSFNLKPGPNTVSIPVNGLYRGEAGSRNNDLKSNIDPSKIIRFDLGFQPKAGAAVTAIYLDHLRLVKESRPASILAFDLGPDSQVLAPGFTAIGPNTVYGKNGASAGLRRGGGGARDDTFPTRLYQDSVGLQDNEFVADVPGPGKYAAWVMFSDPGYWGDEAARFRRRWIESDGEVVWSQQSDPSDYLYRFEGVEPRPGESVWERYMKGVFEARRFIVTAKGKQVAMRFKSDGVNACRVAAIILYPQGDAEAEKWVAEVERRNRAEFENRAVYLGPKESTAMPPKELAGKPLWIGYPGLERDVGFYDSPGGEGNMRRLAARGQRVSFTFAVRPLRPIDGAVELTASDLKSAGGATIAAADVDCRYVHHAIHRGFNDIAYTIGPETLRPVAGAALPLTSGLTRQFWITVHVPSTAAAGEYRGTLTLSAGGLHEQLPLTIDVLDTALDEPDFTMGFYGTDVPGDILDARGDDAWRELLRTLRENGMNSLSGGPGIRFSGFDSAGQPILDFAACDHYFDLLREAGFTKTINGYANLTVPQGLNDGYVIGPTGHGWEKKTGKPFGELLKLVWTAIDAHAKEHHWLPVQASFCDEPRIAEQARAQLELMRAYAQYAPSVNTGGSYSVKWNSNDAFDQATQELFKTMRWSALNLHTQTDLDKAKEYGRELLIYNQGVTRYSFGAYQWAEMRKGVRGRLQWHLLALHGYQFFDLDGREPDSAMINWGRNGIIPTLKLARCREGADDFRFAVTLWNLCEKHAGQKPAEDARAWLEGIARQIGVGQNRRPDGFMEDEAFRNECARRIGELAGR